MGHAAKFIFESNFEPLPVIWQSLQRLFQKVIEGLEGKIRVNCQALGAALQLCLRRSDRRAQTQGISESAAVAAGSESATFSLEENMLPLLLYWLSSRFNKVLMLCKFQAATIHF